METKHTQAFPYANNISIQEGMTLRDYFAAKALQATDLEAYADKYGDKWAESVALDSYMMADAMLKQRELKQ